MNMEFRYLWLLTLFHLVMWIPYILNMVSRIGLMKAMGYEDVPEDKSPWALRMKRAHYNSVENYVLFAALTLIAVIGSRYTQSFENASFAYLIARVVHFLSYTFAVPFVRTLSFFAGVSALIVMLSETASLI